MKQIVCWLSLGQDFDTEVAYLFILDIREANLCKRAVNQLKYKHLHYYSTLVNRAMLEAHESFSHISFEVNIISFKMAWNCLRKLEIM